LELLASSLVRQPFSLSFLELEQLSLQLELTLASLALVLVKAWPLLELPSLELAGLVFPLQFLEGFRA
jgi:hypothetical protein